jgi:hypothetical protein
VHTADAALVSGFHLAFLVGGAIATVGMLVALFGMPQARRAEATQSQAAVAIEI